MTPEMSRDRTKPCRDAGVGSRGRRSNTCAGAVGPNGLCHFHACMRAFEEAWNSVVPLRSWQQPRKVAK
jgi:hypothetical protein